jgi:hypothetical protein
MRLGLGAGRYPSIGWHRRPPVIDEGFTGGRIGSSRCWAGTSPFTICSRSSSLNIRCPPTWRNGTRPQADSVRSHEVPTPRRSAAWAMEWSSGPCFSGPASVATSPTPSFGPGRPSARLPWVAGSSDGRSSATSDRCRAARPVPGKHTPYPLTDVLDLLRAPRDVLGRNTPLLGRLTRAELIQCPKAFHRCTSALHPAPPLPFFRLRAVLNHGGRSISARTALEQN